MINVVKRSEKLQDKLDSNYDATSRKTTQQLKELKKKVKELKQQITNASSFSFNDTGNSTPSTNEQIDFHEDNDKVDGKSTSETRPACSVRTCHKTSTPTASYNGKNESNAIRSYTRQGKLIKTSTVFEPGFIKKVITSI